MHGEFLLVQREHRGVRRSHASLDFAQASQDRRSVLRIVCIVMHDSGIWSKKCSERADCLAGDSGSLKAAAAPLPVSLEVLALRATYAEVHKPFEIPRSPFRYNELCT